MHACRNIKCLVTLFFPRDFRVKYLVFPQVYTIIALGASLVLMPFLTQVAIHPSMEGMPLYLIHPLFTLEFSLWLTTAIVWFITFVFSLNSIRKQALTLIEVVGQNLFVVSLAFITVIIALSGCVGYSENIHLEEFGTDYLLGIPSLPPPNLFTFLRAINGFGILVCEPAWIITVLSKYLRMRTHKPCYMVP